MPKNKKRKSDAQLELSINGVEPKASPPASAGPDGGPGQDESPRRGAGRPNGKPHKIDLPLHRRVDTNFLEYASYVIRDRAIPSLTDGLKPVQRRILWSL